MAGLDAQARYLRQLAAARVERRLAAAEGDLARGDSTVADDLARAAAIDALRERLVAFAAWESGSIGGHILWWDRMTGGAAADDLPEVRGFLDTWGGPVAHDHPAAALEADLNTPAPARRAAVDSHDGSEEHDGNDEPSA